MLTTDKQPPPPCYYIIGQHTHSAYEDEMLFIYLRPPAYKKGFGTNVPADEKKKILYFIMMCVCVMGRNEAHTARYNTYPRYHSSFVYDVIQYNI